MTSQPFAVVSLALLSRLSCEARKNRRYLMSGSAIAMSSRALMMKSVS